jgi:hypothetical protein
MYTITDLLNIICDVMLQFKFYQPKNRSVSEYALHSTKTAEQFNKIMCI